MHFQESKVSGRIQKFQIEVYLNLKFLDSPTGAIPMAKSRNQNYPLCDIEPQNKQIYPPAQLTTNVLQIMPHLLTINNRYLTANASFTDCLIDQIFDSYASLLTA